jgi:arylsulfatase A-like enzyme
MPESVAFWSRPESKNWKGPYYGFQTVEFSIGEADAAYEGGHYARWIRDNHPEVVELGKVEASLDEPPEDLIEAWKSAFPSELHYNTWIAERAIDFVERAESPFFLYVSFPDPHHPFSPPQPYCDLYDPLKMPMPRIVKGELDLMPPYIREEFPCIGDAPNAPETIRNYSEYSTLRAHPTEHGGMMLTKYLKESSIRRAIAHTYGMINMIDERVGWILDALDRKGMASNTFVIFTSDHGEFLGDHGLLHKGPPPYRQLREIPFIISGPGISPGTQIDALTSHIVLMPTILDLAGADIPDSIEGQSLGPLLEGSSTTSRPALFAEHHPRAVPDLYNYSIITHKWRLTLYPSQPEWGELFDLEVDPFEHHNCFLDNSKLDVLKQLQEALNEQFPPKPNIESERLGVW